MYNEFLNPSIEQRREGYCKINMYVNMKQRSMEQHCKKRKPPKKKNVHPKKEDKKPHQATKKQNSDTHRPNNLPNPHPFLPSSAPPCPSLPLSPSPNGLGGSGSPSPSTLANDTYPSIKRHWRDAVRALNADEEGVKNDKSATAEIEYQW